MMKKIICLAAAVLAVSRFAEAQFARTHASFGNKQYYFSWREAPTLNVGWDEANNRCRQLGMNLVSMESPGEANYIRSVVAGERLQFIWTGGRKVGASWVWSPTNRPLTTTQWSFNGGFGRPQPDNREGNEFCLAILNNFYRDGVQWHDVACHHVKPFICEKPAVAAPAAPAPAPAAAARPAFGPPAAARPAFGPPAAARPAFGPPAFGPPAFGNRFFG